MDVWRIVCWIRWRYSANVYSNSRILMYTRVYSCIFVYIRVYSCIYSRTRDRCARGSFVRFSFLVGKKERSHFDSKITLYSIDICSDTMLVECRCRTEIVSERKISRTRRDETRRDETRRDISKDRSKSTLYGFRKSHSATIQRSSWNIVNQHRSRFSIVPVGSARCSTARDAIPWKKCPRRCVRRSQEYPGRKERFDAVRVELELHLDRDRAISFATFMFLNLVSQLGDSRDSNESNVDEYQQKQKKKNRKTWICFFSVFYYSIYHSY
jgi:hypothetical protein